MRVLPHEGQAPFPEFTVVRRPLPRCALDMIDSFPSKGSIKRCIHSVWYYGYCWNSTIYNKGLYRNTKADTEWRKASPNTGFEIKPAILRKLWRSGDVGLQHAAPHWVLHALDGLFFNLTNAFFGQVVTIPDFLQRQRRATIQSETELDNFRFLVG